MGLIPGSGRSPGEGNGNPLLCSCLENPRDGGTWWAAICGLQRVGHDWSSSRRSILNKIWWNVVSVAKNLPANAGGIRDMGLIPGSGRSSGGEHSSSLQYSCLENPMDREAWWATVHGVTKSQTWLKWLSIAQHREYLGYLAKDHRYMEDNIRINSSNVLFQAFLWFTSWSLPFTVTQFPLLNDADNSELWQ